MGFQEGIICRLRMFLGKKEPMAAIVKYKVMLVWQIVIWIQKDKDDLMFYVYSEKWHFTFNGNIHQVDEMQL